MIRDRFVFGKILWVYRDILKYIFVYFIPCTIVGLVANNLLGEQHHLVAGIMLISTGVLMLGVFLYSPS